MFEGNMTHIRGFLKNAYITFSSFLFLGFIISGFPKRLYAQYYHPVPKEGIPIQTVYAELLGNSIIYSLNYDVVWKNNLGFRIGGSVYGSRDDNHQNTTYNEWQQYFTILVTGNYYVGKGANRLELGMGFVGGELDKSINPDYSPRNFVVIKVKFRSSF